jgi:antitoxin (DNA-binding transcriptional repressor) of toxin-antitoxin stability system
MKMGIREFRERLSEVAHGEEPVIITHHGKVLGRFLPERRKAAEAVDLDEWAADLERRRDAWRAATPDWRERMAAYGLDPDGEPIDR